MVSQVDGRAVDSGQGVSADRSAGLEDASAGSAGSATGAARWDERVVHEVLAHPYVRMVLFTDRAGALLRAFGVAAGRGERLQGRRVDVALSALEQATDSLGLGEHRVGALLCAEGVLVTCSDPHARAAIVATENANLGNLIIAAKNLFPGGAQ